MRLRIGQLVACNLGPDLHTTHASASETTVRFGWYYCAKDQRGEQAFRVGIKANFAEDTTPLHVEAD